jgi:hypothetical protein
MALRFLNDKKEALLEVTGPLYAEGIRTLSKLLVKRVLKKIKGTAE